MICTFPEDDFERNGLSRLYEIGLSGKRTLYPEMKRDILRFTVHFPRSYDGTGFKEPVHLVLYLDGGPPTRLEIDLNELLFESVAEHEKTANQIEEAYPKVKPLLEYIRQANPKSPRRGETKNPRVAKL